MASDPKNQLFQVLDVAELTDRGLKRQRNEDASRMLVPPMSTSESGLGALFLVCDGMGGLGGGDTASRAAIDETIRTFYGRDNTETDPVDRLQESLESANIFVREQAGRVGLARIGSTGAGVLLRPDGDAVIFNVGDCRVYRVRKGEIERISRDQSVMERQIESGMLTEEAARSARNSMVTAFLGQPIPITPYFHREHVQMGDVYLACSDGLWSLVENQELLPILQRNSAAGAVNKLIKLALQRGGTDNVTAVIVRIGKPPSNAGRVLLPLLAALLLLWGILGLLYVSGQNKTNVAAATTVVATSATSATEVPATPQTPTIIATTESPPTAIPTTVVPTTIVPTTVVPTTQAPTDVPSVATTAAPPPTTVTGTPDATQALMLTVQAIQSAAATNSGPALLSPSTTLKPSATPEVKNTEIPTKLPTSVPPDTNTPEPSVTSSSTVTATPSLTPTQTPPPTDIVTSTSEATVTEAPTATVTNTPTVVLSPTLTATVTPTRTVAPTRTFFVPPTTTLDPTLYTLTYTPTITKTPTPTRTLTPTITPSPTLTPTLTLTVTPGGLVNTPEKTKFKLGLITITPPPPSFRTTP